MPGLDLAVAWEEEHLKAQAQVLAQQLDLPLNPQAPNQLVLTSTRLLLRIPPFRDLYPDFTFSHWQHRRQEGKKQALVKACKPQAGLKILDITAGWGRDAAILASFGAEVLMLERNPIMVALLQDALARQESVDQAKLQLSLLATDAKNYFQALPASELPPLIYMDPMHPARLKSALVKKEMQVLQKLIGSDQDAKGVLDIIGKKISAARREGDCKNVKLVIKWPASLPPLLSLSPQHQIIGKNIRFDIFLL